MIIDYHNAFCKNKTFPQCSIAWILPFDSLPTNLTILNDTHILQDLNN